MNSTLWSMRLDQPTTLFHRLMCLHSLVRNSANHTPLYFLLLNLWGHIAGTKWLGRVLTIFFGLLSLAMTYRLVRDFVAPIAGSVCINHRRVTCILQLLLCARAHVSAADAGFDQLFYGSICASLHKPIVARSERLACCRASCYVFAYTHAFSALLFLSLSVHIICLSPQRTSVGVGGAGSMVAALYYFRRGSS